MSTCNYTPGCQTEPPPGRKRCRYHLDYQRKYTDAYRAAHRERCDRLRVLCRYRMTIPQYDALEAAQGGVCAICENVCSTGRRLAVDHDHATNRIRGLLCARCNRGIGLLREDTGVLVRAIAYLGRGGAE